MNYVRLSIGLLGLFCLLCQPVMADQAETDESSRPSLHVAGISASVGEDDPRVLYILPWQNPSLPRRPRAELNQQAANLVQPSSPRVLESHRQFRDSLNPLVLAPTPIGANRGQP
ncbi:hypothetical protein [Marinobacter halophilus]|uniref:Uncharacterized protein n=1 Tax=Marinobacter halophilus TaxID=1323740 RepID=A0A2T1K8H1_9GAMM|nr:hypothetical protein [Marinobacter halophilus]PSF06434.1 hypothetical protein C7H08_15085 [Marinobacter halophilus]GGC72588.1 hypothetical protein GCM10011362_21340 [Marinobacter halophilus]